MNLRSLWGMAVVLLFITACGDSRPAPEPTVTQLAGTPTTPPTMTPAGEVYPAPEATVASTATPLDYPAPREAEAYPAPTECEIAPTERFASLLESQPVLQDTLGCPTEEAFQTNAAWQVFENEHQMVWLESEDAILATYNDAWHGFEDTFDESTDPEYPPEAPTPPADDRYRAKRGFGKVWINVVDDVGFAVSGEEAYDATVQQYDGGWLVTTPFGQVFVLVGMTDAQTGSGPYQAWLERDDGWVSGTERD